MVPTKEMRNDKLNTKQLFICHFYDFLLYDNVFHRFGQYFYAISRARVVIRSGSSIVVLEATVESKFFGSQQ